MNYEQMIKTLIDAHSDTIEIIGTPLREFVTENKDITFHLSTGDQTVPSIPKMQQQLLNSALIKVKANSSLFSIKAANTSLNVNAGTVYMPVDYHIGVAPSMNEISCMMTIDGIGSDLRAMFNELQLVKLDYDFDTENKNYQIEVNINNSDNNRKYQASYKIYKFKDNNFIHSGYFNFRRTDSANNITCSPLPLIFFIKLEGEDYYHLYFVENFTSNTQSIYNSVVTIFELE